MESSIGKVYKIFNFYFICFEEADVLMYGLNNSSGKLSYSFWYKGLEEILWDDLPEHVQEIFSDPLLEIEYRRMKG